MKQTFIIKQMATAIAGAGGAGPLKELSGPAWVSRFPGSNSLLVLKSPFRENITTFIQALKDAGSLVNVSATLRPAARAYLMHYSFLISKKKQDPTTVPPMVGVNIEWNHGSEVKSVAAAAAMVAAFKIATAKTAPSLSSNHINANAVDMTISNFAGKSIRKKDGTLLSTKTFNDLIAVGGTYSVFHKVADDMPHWSPTGR